MWMRALAGVAGTGLTVGLVVGLPLAAHADSFEVTTEQDSGPGSLRDAIAQANANPGADTISFAPDVHTIELESPIEITGPLAITGPGSDQLTVGRASADEFDQFQVDVDGDVGFTGLTLAGRPDGRGRAITAPTVGSLVLDDVAVLDQRDVSDVPDEYGDCAGISVAEAEDITIRDSRFAGNHADWTSVFCIDDLAGTLHIEDSTFENNLSNEGHFGALWGGTVGIVEIQNSTFSGNTGVGETGSGAVALEDISQLTVSGSTFTDNHIGGPDFDAGGAISVANVDEEYGPGDGSLTITESVFNGNTAFGSGGAVYAEWVAGLITIADTEFSNNAALDDEQYTGGGAVFVLSGIGGFTIERSRFLNNTTLQDGGAFMFLHLGNPTWRVPVAQIVDSTFIGNEARLQGAAVEIDEVNGDLEIQRSTFADNTGDGEHGASLGSLWLDGDMRVVNSTFDESATAIYVEEGDGAVSVENSTVVAPGLATLLEVDLILRNTVVDSGAAPVASVPSNTLTVGWSALTDVPDPAQYGGFVDEGGNLFGLADTGLGPLAGNGGPTPTMLPDPTSVLIDAGNASLPDLPETDQRLEQRLVGGGLDIGSVELQAGPPDELVASWFVTPDGPLLADGIDAYTATVSVVNQADEPVEGVEVAFLVPEDVTVSATMCTTGADGTCSIDLTSTVAGLYEVAATIGDEPVGEPVLLEFVAGPASPITSTIEADPTTIAAGGEESTITVRLYDASGNPLSTSGGVVTIFTDLGQVTATTDHLDGTYTAVLSSAEAGTATLTFTIDDVPADDTATVLVTAHGGLPVTGPTVQLAVLALILLIGAGGLLLTLRRVVRPE